MTNNARGVKNGEHNKWIMGHQCIGRHKPQVRFTVVDRGFTSPCWETKPISSGYGSVSVNGKNVRAHRFVYEQVHGPISERFELDHLCRNRCCANPNHLEQVTRAVNVQRGASTKLKPEQVAEIRAAYANGESQQKIADRYGVNQTMIGFIIRRVSWKNV